MKTQKIKEVEKNFFLDEKVLAALSTQIQNEYNKLINIIKDIKYKDRIIKYIDGTAGKVSISDIIAYQIGWGKLLIVWYEAGLKGEMPDMPGEGFLKWDYNGLAKLFYKKYEYDSNIKQIEQFYKAVNKIINIVEYEYKTKNLDKLGVWDWCTLASGKQWPLSKWIKINTVAPYKRATTLIRKFLKAL